MKSPIVRYHGAKFYMANKIIPLIAEVQHTVYIEPFAGSASVFFRIPHLPQFRNYLLNDTYGLLINFYRHAQEHPAAFVKYAKQRGVISKELFCEACALCEKGARDLPTAWGFFYANMHGFAGQRQPTAFNNYLAGQRKNKSIINWTGIWANTLAELPAMLARLQRAMIDHTDALKCIQRQDAPHTLFYIDPPYIGTHCAHYAHYTESDYAALLDTLANIRGKFILSSFDTPQLAAAVAANNWQQKRYECTRRQHSPTPRRKTKTEILTWNFDRGAML